MKSKTYYVVRLEVNGVYSLAWIHRTPKGVAGRVRKLSKRLNDTIHLTIKKRDRTQLISFF